MSCLSFPISRAKGFSWLLTALLKTTTCHFVFLRGNVCGLGIDQDPSGQDVLDEDVSVSLSGAEESEWLAREEVPTLPAAPKESDPLWLLGEGKGVPPRSRVRRVRAPPTGLGFGESGSPCPTGSVLAPSPTLSFRSPAPRPLSPGPAPFPGAPWHLRLGPQPCLSLFGPFPVASSRSIPTRPPPRPQFSGRSPRPSAPSAPPPPAPPFDVAEAAPALLAQPCSAQRPGAGRRGS